MNELRMVLSAEPTATRVMLINAKPDGSEVLLKARLSAEPAHPRAVQWLLEAAALWEGRTVHAALCAAEPADTYVTRLYPAWFTDFGNALYSLKLVERHHARRVHRDAFKAMGDFRDLRQMSFAMGDAP